MSVRTRLAAMLTAGFVLAGMVACAESPKESEPLAIWVRKPPGSNTEKTAKELAAKFTAKTGIKTEVTALFDDFETKLQQAAAQKKLPDLVINDAAQLGTLVKQKVVTKVDKAAIAGGDKLTPAAWDAAKAADGSHYAVPFSAQSFALFIRKDWREKAGLPVPTTWAELDTLAKAFTTKDTYGYVVPGSTKRGYMSWYFTSFMWSAGADYFDGGGKPAVDSQSMVDAVTWFKGTFCTNKTVAPGAVTMETTQAHPVFETGKAGIYFTGPYNMARFDKSLGKDKYEVVALPAGPGGKAVSLAEGENVYLMAGSKNTDGQRKFAEFAISAEGQTIGMAGDTDGNIVRLPVNTEVDLAKVRTDARWQVFSKIYQDSGRYVPNVAEWTPFRQASSETINAIVADCGSDPKAQLAKLATTFTAELAKQQS